MALNSAILGLLDLLALLALLDHLALLVLPDPPDLHVTAPEIYLPSFEKARVCVCVCALLFTCRKFPTV